jgi:hypothetical protein
MAQRDVAINLLTKLQDKGFKDLEKSTKKSNKVLSDFGKRLVAVFSVTAVTAFAKASVRAFLEEEKAITRLNVALENAGEGFNTLRAEEFISSLQRSARVLDSELRPALITLTNAGVKFEQSQKLLNLALDVSTGTGRDLQSVVQGLARSFNGNNTALQRLNLGLTKAQLKVATFDDITTLLSLKFEGQASAAANTYAGRIQGLTIAVDEAQELIGKSLVTAIDNLSSSSNGAEKAIAGLAKETSNLLLGFSQLVKTFKSFSLERYFQVASLAAKEFVRSGLNPIIAARNTLQELSQPLTLEESLSAGAAIGLPDFSKLQKQSEVSRQITVLNAKLAAQAQAKELAAAKKKAAADKKAAAEKAKADQLDRLRKALQFKFDIEAINQQAALQRQISDIDKDRLLQLSALKISSYQSDEEALKTLKAATEGRYDEAMNLEKVYALLRQAGFANDLAALQAIDDLDPYIEFKTNLDDILEKLLALLGLTDLTGGDKKGKKGRAAIPVETNEQQAAREYQRMLNAIETAKFKENIVDEANRQQTMVELMRIENARASLPVTALTPATGADQVVVNVSVAGSVIAQNDLVATITDAVYQSQRTGNALVLDFK